MNESKLFNNSKKIRNLILDLAFSSGEGHIASSFSIVEILVALNECFKNRKKLNFKDSFILSKGHAVFALYSLYRFKNILNDKIFQQICKNNSKYIGHVPTNMVDENFIYGSGSLGHGLPFSVGYAFRRNHKSNKSKPVFVLVGDGEFNEGSCFESLMLLNKFPNISLKIIIDCNLSSERAIPIINFLKNLKNIYNLTFVDGHNLTTLFNVFQSSFDSKENQIIICNTQKGYPLKEMINNPIWHHRKLTLEHYLKFKDEILNL